MYNNLPNLTPHQGNEKRARVLASMFVLRHPTRLNVNDLPLKCNQESKVYAH